MTVTMSNPAHPEYGEIIVTLPIPDERYNAVIEQFGYLDLGDVTARDCQINKIKGSLPVLQRLDGQRVNIDEIDFLARQTQDFSKSDVAAYQETANRIGFSGIKELINLSAAVNLQNAREGIELRKLYNGGAFPGPYKRNSVMILSVFSPERYKRSGISHLKLPMNDLKFERMLQRGELEGGELDVAICATGCSLRQLPADFDHTSPRDFNRLAKCIAALSPKDNQKLIAVKEFVKATEATQIIALAENLSMFRVKGAHITYHGEQDLAELMAPETPDQGMKFGGMT